tara:strand:+ start:560 stop:1009 length:450 start_codon:yes stop_codon:yes gene_type:complete
MLNSVEETKAFIRQHEGKVNTIYKDHLGFKTWGIGHLVQPEDQLQEGIEYSDMAVEEFFKKDFQKALNGAKALLNEQLDDDYPDQLLYIMTCLVFQLGQAGMRKFKKMWSALRIPDYGLAATELLDSRFAKQTPKRAAETAELIRSLGA